MSQIEELGKSIVENSIFGLREKLEALSSVLENGKPFVDLSNELSEKFNDENFILTNKSGYEIVKKK